MSTSPPSSIPGLSESAASTVQNLPSSSLFGEGVSLVSSSTRPFSSALPSATTVPDSQGTPSASPNTLPPSFLSIFAPVPTVSESLLPTYSPTTETSPFGSAAIGSSSAVKSELSSIPAQTSTATSPVITVTIIETATLISYTEIGGAGVLPSAVDSTLSSLVLAEPTSGMIAAFISPSNVSLTSSWQQATLCRRHWHSRHLVVTPPLTRVNNSSSGYWTRSIPSSTG